LAKKKREEKGKGTEARREKTTSTPMVVCRARTSPIPLLPAEKKGREKEKGRKKRRGEEDV